MSNLVIKTLSTVVAGKFVDQFVVIDGEGNLIGKKAHRTQEEAQAELGSLKYYAEGLAFARATAPEGTADKALVGKANVVAAYLMWKEAPAVEAVEAPVAEQAVEETVEAPVAELPADEEF